MNAAGIDVSSRKSTVAILRPFGEVVKLPFDVSHSAEGLTALAEQLKALDGETRVVMEHTGRYYESVANVLHEAGLYVSAVNPLLIKLHARSSHHEGRKPAGVVDWRRTVQGRFFYAAMSALIKLVSCSPVEPQIVQPSSGKRTHSKVKP